MDLVQPTFPSLPMQNSDYRIRGVPSMLIESMWRFAEPYIKRALDHAAGEIAPADLKKFCQEKDIQLWLISKGSRVVGAATTEIVVYPQKKHCRIITVAGSGFRDWVNLFDREIMAWAKSNGCHALEAHVRRGFVKKIEPIGYRHMHSVVIKKLDIIHDNTGMEASHHGEEEQRLRTIDANHAEG